MPAKETDHIRALFENISRLHPTDPSKLQTLQCEICGEDVSGIYRASSIRLLCDDCWEVESKYPGTGELAALARKVNEGAG